MLRLGLPRTSHRFPQTRTRRSASVVDALEAGTVRVNTHDMVDPALPFGGFKASRHRASGIGREHGRASPDTYTETRPVCIAY